MGDQIQAIHFLILLGVDKYPKINYIRVTN